MLKLLAISAITIMPLTVSAEPTLTDGEVIIHQTAEEPTTFDLLVDDIVIDCGSTLYHDNGCSVGHSIFSW